MKTRTILLMSFGAILITIFGRIFLFAKITATPDNSNLQANIQGPLGGGASGHIQKDTSTATGITNNTSTGTIASGVRILFPPRVSPEDITALTQAVRQTVGIESIIVRAESMQTYEDARQQSMTSTSPDRDIILVSTFHGQGSIATSKHIPFTTDISAYFSPLVSKLIRSTSGTFVPYAIDPLLTIIHHQLRPTTGPFSRDLFQHTIASPRILPSDVPHLGSLFGVGTTDILLGRNNKEAYPGYTEILSTFAQQAIQTQTPGILTYIAQIPTRDFSAFRDITHLVAEKLPQCTTFPLQCILRYQLADIGFVHLSDLDLLHTSFPQGNRREQNYIITNFPSSSLGYPITARGFIIPSKVKTPAPAYERIRGYLLLATQQRLISSSYTLSPFAELLETQLLQSLYRNIHDQITYGYLTQFDITTKDSTFRQQLRDVLDQKYNTELFLRTYQNQVNP